VGCRGRGGKEGKHARTYKNIWFNMYKGQKQGLLLMMVPGDLSHRFSAAYVITCYYMSDVSTSQEYVDRLIYA
jgi:hypothetical protein